MRTHNTNKGYSLIEMVFYTSIFAILTIAIINSLVTMTKTFREASVQTDLKQGSSIMERMSREIRKAYNIAAISSTSLTLNSRDEGGASQTIAFALSGTNIEFSKNSLVVGNLNTSKVLVTSLSFTQITTTRGKAVKIDLSVQSNQDSASRTKNFNNTVVLRGDYEE